MTISEWLSSAQQRLADAGITTTRLDVLVLLADELSEDKSWILAHKDDILRGETEKLLNKKVIQRTHHTPLAYIRGHAEFYGREFAVNAHVLVPRSESEGIIDLLKLHVDDPTHVMVIDIGTGSGCLATTALLETNVHCVVATDLSSDALSVAQRNASRLGADITFMQGNLLDPVVDCFANEGETYIVLANLPYVPTNYTVNEAAKHEPPLALFSGNDGLAHYEQLFKQIDALSIKPAVIITESLDFQHSLLRTLAVQHNYMQSSQNGLAQAFTLKA